MLNSFANKGTFMAIDCSKPPKSLLMMLLSNKSFTVNQAMLVMRNNYNRSLAINMSILELIPSEKIATCYLTGILMLENIKHAIEILINADDMLVYLRDVDEPENVIPVREWFNTATIKLKDRLMPGEKARWSPKYSKYHYKKGSIEVLGETLSRCRREYERLITDPCRPS